MDRYYVLTDKRPRIKLNPAGYRSMTEAQSETMRAVGSGKCTAARMVRALRGSEGLTFACPLRTLSSWPPDLSRVVVVDMKRWSDFRGYDYTTTDGHGIVVDSGSIAGSFDLVRSTGTRWAEKHGYEVLLHGEMARIRA